MEHWVNFDVAPFRVYFIFTIDLKLNLRGYVFESEAKTRIFLLKYCFYYAFASRFRFHYLFF